jgi:hypothetical protein
VGTRPSRTATVGSHAPAISLTAADGTPWTLSGALEAGPVALVFLRGFF